MHEYSVVSELVAGLLPRLEGHPGKVTAVYLRKGEMRILSDYALKSAFEIVSQGTRLEGASLEIETVEARISCPKCGYTTLIRKCPRCGKIIDEDGRRVVVSKLPLATALGAVSGVILALTSFFLFPSPALISLSFIVPTVLGGVADLATRARVRVE